MRKPKKERGLFLRYGNWCIDYYAYGKRRREKIGTSKSLAINVLRKRKLEIAENRYLDIKKQAKVKFKDFIDEYVELHLKPNRKSWNKSEVYNVNRLNKFFAGKHLYEITTLMVEKFKIERRKEVGPATTNRALSCLRSIFNKAILWDKFNGVNPVKGVKFFRENNARLRYLEKEEIAKLLKNCNGHLKPIVIFALHTGMRRGEILGLKWRDIDFRT